MGAVGRGLHECLFAPCGVHAGPAHCAFWLTSPRLVLYITRRWACPRRTPTRSSAASPTRRPLHPCRWVPLPALHAAPALHAMLALHAALCSASEPAAAPGCPSSHRRRSCSSSLVWSSVVIPLHPLLSLAPPQSLKAQGRLTLDKVLDLKEQVGRAQITTYFAACLTVVCCGQGAGPEGAGVSQETWQLLCRRSGHWVVLLGWDQVCLTEHTG